jgi:hypothetical protein
MATVAIPLAVGSYQDADLRASNRRLVGCFSETAPQSSMQDSKQPYYQVTFKPVSLRRFPGATKLADNSTLNGVRGFREMNGVQYVVIGPTLYTMSSAGVLTQVGTGISGTGFVRMADNTECLFILLPGTSTGYTYTTANGFATYTDAQFLTYGAIDVWFIDTYLAFLALNGRTFYNDDGQVISGTGPITFTTGATFTREFGTDTFVGGTVDHREVVLFGERTSEGYVNTGNAVGSPFSSAPDTFMETGCHPLCAYSIANQDESVFWVANDLTVRRRNGQTPDRVSNSGIENILATANLTGCYALTPSIAGHAFWILVMPNDSRTICYDCLTKEWFELNGAWPVLCWYNAFGKQLLGYANAGQVFYLDPTTNLGVDGADMTTFFILQAVYSKHNRIAHRRLELVVSGVGAIKLSVSNDSGATFYDRETFTFTPTTGEQPRAVWNNLGQSRDRAYKGTVSGAAPTFTIVDAQADGAPGIR